MKKRQEERAARRRRTNKLTLCGLFVGLSVAIMYLGTVIEVLDLTLAVVASLFCIVTVIEAGGNWVWGVYASTSVLSVLLLPNKFPAVVYLLFAGYYPIIKEKIEGRIPLRAVRVLLKLVIFNLAFAGILAAAIFVLKLPVQKDWFLLAIAALGNVTFLVYDFALTRLITTYISTIRPRLSFLKRK